jgi:hypothetical protein
MCIHNENLSFNSFKGRKITKPASNINTCKEMSNNMSFSRDFEFLYSLNVESVLNKSYQGQLVLMQNGPLQPKYQQTLCRLIVDEFVNNRKSMGKVEFESVSKKIVELFPEEIITQYYVPSQQTNGKKRSRGRIADRYYNATWTIKRLLRLGQIT